MKKIVYIAYILTISACAADKQVDKEVADRVCLSPACESLAVLSTGSRVAGASSQAQRWQARRRSYTKEEIIASEQRHKERIKRVLSTSN